MAVFRIERTRDYTVMSNHHLRNANLSLKAKGLLSMMLSLPEDWNYTTRGLAKICKEGVDAIGAALRELEGAGYIVRHQRRDKSGRITDTEYVIYEQPHHGNLELRGLHRTAVLYTIQNLEVNQHTGDLVLLIYRQLPEVFCWLRGFVINLI